ncbi:MAG TPA: hypothetical protein VND87_11625 [Stellaceae bacterium]|nr:hypothetical protein [Stellaceae bacterium]
MRRCGLILGAALALLAGIGTAAAQAPALLIGNWMTTWFPNTVGEIFVTVTYVPNGQIREHLMNRQAVAYDLFGTYQYNSATSTVQFVFADYAPKQMCSPIGCQPAPVPPGLNTPTSAQLVFPNPNQMMARTADGTTMIWSRTN